ncbi:hypothetical protein ACW9HR_38280 [Nocardia gipuzkoensis]
MERYVDYAVDLGGGLLIDSQGNIRRGAPPNVPVYASGLNAPLDFGKVGEALGAFKKATKDFGDPNSTGYKDAAEVLGKLGVPVDVLGLLSAAGKIAGTVAPVFMVASFAIDALKMLGLFDTGPSPLEMLLQQRFDEISAQIGALATWMKDKDIAEGRNGVTALRNAATDYADDAYTSLISPALPGKRSDLKTAHEAHIKSILKLFDYETWKATAFPDQYKWVRFNLHNLHFVDSAGFHRVPFESRGEIVFDHRLMVSTVTYAAMSYISSLRAMVPEYRTGGEHRSTLRTLADKIAALAESMRREGLARTVYQPQDFTVVVTDSYVSPSVVVFNTIIETQQWPVGAIDLRYHTDRFFGERTGPATSYKPGVIAGMNFGWVPPARLVRRHVDPFLEGQWVIDNPEECAAAANAQAERAYAEILVASGYVELQQLAAMFKHEASPPSSSQTVSVRKTKLWRQEGDPYQREVVSREFKSVGKITAQAWSWPARCESETVLDIQGIRKDTPLRYRVMLRTLVPDTTLWREVDYTDFYSSRYVADQEHPGFKVLEFFRSDSWCAEGSEKVLVDWTTAPFETAIDVSGVAELDAVTFDWWIPSADPRPLLPFEPKWPVDLTQIVPEKLRPRSLRPHYLPHTSGVIDDVVTQLGKWTDGKQTWDGQHREVRGEKVTVGYTLRWQPGKLVVELDNNPQNRNFIVYLVVEEKISTGQFLHSAVPIPMNGLLTYVPESFFAREFKAMTTEIQTAEYFTEDYGKINPHPLEYGQNHALVIPDFLHDPESLSRFMQAAQAAAPSLLEQAIGRATRLPG